MKEIKSLSDEQLVSKIEAGDREALSHLYQKHFPMVLNFITANSGSEADAKDIYQEAIIVLYENIRSGEFRLISKLKTYIYAVARRLWLKQLKQKSRFTGEVKENERFDDWEKEMDRQEKLNQQKLILAKSMDELGEPCRTILTDFFYRSLSMEEIAEKMGYTNAANAKNQKYKCFQRLKKLMKAS